MAFTFSGVNINGSLQAAYIPPPGVTTYSLWSWGENSVGKLGLGDTTNRSSPTQIGALTTWLSVSAGKYQGFAIDNSNKLWAWGQNSYRGPLGQGDTISRSSPTQVGALTNWSKVYAARHAVFSIKTDGTLWAWGDNRFGKLGLGNTTDYSSPKQLGALTDWTTASVFAGTWNTFTIKSDGTLWGWGYNDAGQIGVGNITSYSSPKQVGALTNWASVGVGNSVTHAIKTDGTLWTWGYNGQGQLGLGNTTDRSSPVQVGALTNWLQVCCSRYGSTAIKTDGTLWSWGANSYGSLGLQNTTAYSSPKQVGALTTWASLGKEESYATSSAVKTDGTLWSWGYNNFGQLGLDNTTNYSSPKQVGVSTNWSYVYKQRSGMIAVKPA